MPTAVPQPRTNSEPARSPCEVVDLASTDWTPSAGFNGSARALWVGTTGNVKVDVLGGSTAITFKNVPVGWLEVTVTKVYKTGTTASDIIAVS